MPREIVDTILPPTMVGSYPRPHWFKDQLLGRDVRVAFKNVDHAEAYEDATRVMIQDQEEASLDIVTDGQMSYLAEQLRGPLPEMPLADPDLGLWPDALDRREQRKLAVADDPLGSPASLRRNPAHTWSDTAEVAEPRRVAGKASSRQIAWAPAS